MTRMPLFSNNPGPVSYTHLDVYKRQHLDEPQKFKFNWDSLVGTGLSSKDYIAPSSFLFKEGRYFRVGPSVGAVSFLQIQATKLYDTLLNALLNIESSQIVSIHAKALDQGAALKTVKRKLSDLDKAKIDEQKRAVRSGFDMDILPPDLVTFGKEAEKLLEDLQNHDEKMFMVTILLVHTAPTKQKLENITYSVNEMCIRDRVDTVCSTRKMIRIGGEDFPKEIVKSRLLKLDSSHIEYVISSLRENTTKVRNIRAYLLTSLYNAPTTINSYYTALVNHDMYGSG